MDNLLGIVVIGRNEGDRLKVCLDSVIQYSRNIVYVDSGSTDGSVDTAKIRGVEVVNLDLDIPFTAARARNEGFKRLVELNPDITLVQFVDGDCEIVEGWLEQASEYLTQHSDIAVVCGRRRERYPERSIFNMLCDIEWNLGSGEIKGCGGDAIYRVDIFKDVGGFNPDLIAGEEPDLCLRIRMKKLKIWCLDIEMTLHDANITRFSQWWKRSVRSGYAYALGADIHGAKPERHWVKEINRIRLWGLYLPVGLLILGFVNYLFFYGFLIYVLKVIRLAFKYNESIAKNWSYAFFLTVAKFAEAQGQINYLWDKLINNKRKIIEYK